MLVGLSLSLSPGKFASKFIQAVGKIDCFMGATQRFVFLCCFLARAAA